MELADLYRPVFRFWLGPNLVIGIRRPKDLEIVLNHSSTLGKSVMYDVLKMLIGEGLISGPGK